MLETDHQFASSFMTRFGVGLRGQGQRGKELTPPRLRDGRVGAESERPRGGGGARGREGECEDTGLMGTRGHRDDGTTCGCQRLWARPFSCAAPSFIPPRPGAALLGTSVPFWPMGTQATLQGELWGPESLNSHPQHPLFGTRTRVLIAAKFQNTWIIYFDCRVLIKSKLIYVSDVYIAWFNYV